MHQNGDRQRTSRIWFGLVLVADTRYLGRSMGVQPTINRYVVVLTQSHSRACASTPGKRAGSVGSVCDCANEARGNRTSPSWICDRDAGGSCHTSCRTHTCHSARTGLRITEPILKGEVAIARSAKSLKGFVRLVEPSARRAELASAQGGMRCRDGKTSLPALPLRQAGSS